MSGIAVEVLRAIAARGESKTVEFKNSTAQLPRAGETLCGMLNGEGGIILIGVSPTGELRGQDVSDSTQQDVARMLERFQPSAPVEMQIAVLPDYPQVRVKMGRFRGTKITGDILDNKQEFLHAFAVVREAMAFLDRTLPLSGHFVKGRIQREDRLPVPADALREVILNAVMHRDYSNPGGDTAIAVFDDRIEISSYGNLLPGVTPELLSGPHKSILRNPLIAQTFHRTGAVETWGRGTNRVIDECREYGVELPVFELLGNSLVVTFRAKIGLGPDLVPERHQVGTKSALSRHQVEILEQCRNDSSIGELMVPFGRTDRTKFRNQLLAPLLEMGWIEMTIPDKPRSSKQQYRITARGRKALSEEVNT